jgi:hypothetical protein
MEQLNKDSPDWLGNLMAEVKDLEPNPLHEPAKITMPDHYAIGINKEKTTFNIKMYYTKKDFTQYWVVSFLKDAQNVAEYVICNTVH